jgi:hypothetical protein
LEIQTIFTGNITSTGGLSKDESIIVNARLTSLNMSVNKGLTLKKCIISGGVVSDGSLFTDNCKFYSGDMQPISWESNYDRFKEVGSLTIGDTILCRNAVFEYLSALTFYSTQEFYSCKFETVTLAVFSGSPLFKDCIFKSTVTFSNVTVGTPIFEECICETNLSLTGAGVILKIYGGNWQVAVITLDNATAQILSDAVSLSVIKNSGVWNNRVASYDNVASGLVATTVQDAIDEVAESIGVGSVKTLDNELIAVDSISPLDVVEMTATGIRKYSGQTEEYNILSDENYYDAGGSEEAREIVSLTATSSVAIFSDSSGALCAQRLDYSLGTVSFGTKYVIDSTVTVTKLKTTKAELLSAGRWRISIVYIRDGTVDRTLIVAIIIEASGISAGTPQVVYAGLSNAVSITLLQAAFNGGFVVYSPGISYGMVFNFTGETAYSFGTPEDLYLNGGVTDTAVSFLEDNKAFLVERYTGGGDTTITGVLVASGTTTLFYSQGWGLAPQGHKYLGSKKIYSSGVNLYTLLWVASSVGTSLIYLKVVRTEGTTNYSFGGLDYTLTLSAYANGLDLIQLSPNLYILIYSIPSTGCYARFIITSGSSFSVGSVDNELEAGDTGSVHGDAMNSKSFFVTVGHDVTTSITHEVKFLGFGFNFSKYLGISKESVGGGNPCNIVTFGEVNGFTGLSVGEVYYCEPTNGDIVTWDNLLSTGYENIEDFRLGVAISTDKLQLQK